MVWHPADTLLGIAWLFPSPGTTDPFAEIRYLPVTVDDVTVWRFRAVRVDVDPRTLIGYYETLDDAAMGAHRHALHAAIRPELNETRR